MKRNKSIRLKAIFLLAVFALNTLVGFACAVGLNMRSNTSHHDHDHTASVKPHHHNTATDHHHEEAASAKKTGEDDNCCNNDVVKFSQLDKLLTQTVKTSVEVPVIPVQLLFLYQSWLSSFSYNDVHLLQFLRPYVLSSRGIRVSIQSFQI